MDLENIKRISCTDYLYSVGAVKDKKSNKSFTYFKSPFRNEKTASLSINEHKNTWFDFGAGFGGDVISLVMTCERLDFKDALNKLKESSFNHVIISEKPKSTLVITDVRELANNSLINYLRFDRMINIDLAKKYLKEVHFENKGRKCYAIGFGNDKGGFELRNKFLKIATSPKWISSFKGVGATNVFEGFMDFLSAMTYYNCEPKQSVVVLNSVSMVNHISPADNVRFWGDNDTAGNECLAKLNAKDERQVYKGFKDFNDFLCHNKSELANVL